MPYRDAEGHFCSREEAISQGTFNPAEEEEPTPEPVTEPEHPEGWGGEEEVPRGTVHVDTGRGQTVEVEVGLPFVATLERLAEEAHYGGFYRIFLNGSEVVNPEDAPETIEPGMRIVITSYDKVG